MHCPTVVQILSERKFITAKHLIRTLAIALVLIITFSATALAGFDYFDSSRLKDIKEALFDSNGYTYLDTISRTLSYISSKLDGQQTPTSYKTVSARFSDELDELVNAEMQQGWQAQGGLSIHPDSIFPYHQTMVRYD